MNTINQKPCAASVISCLRLLTFLCTALLVLYGCSPIHHTPQQPGSKQERTNQQYKQIGKASFYAQSFQNETTASGERFNNTAMTAAHKTLPLGSKVKVTNLRNGKSVVVTINDRGPYVSGRIIDLTKKAFRQIASSKEGIIRVGLTPIQ